MPTLDSLALRRTAASPLHSASPDTAIAEAPSTMNAEPSFEETEEEASQEGAFNEETGEINWNCPCLGGMAHGPCGEQFRAAFSCFVYSNEEPKGMDCIDRFKGMQDCFRQHPEIYGDELADSGPDDGPEEPGIAGIAETGEDVPVPAMPDTVASTRTSVEATSSPQATSSTTPPPTTLSSPTSPDAGIHPAHTTDVDDNSKTARAKSATEQVRSQHSDTGEGGDELVPKEWHDSRKAA